MPEYQSPYGGRNDRALWLARECQLEEAFLLRARKEDGMIQVSLLCNDIFAWACADCEPLPEEEWLGFEKSLQASRDHFGWEAEELHWFASAWSVKLRGVAPQKPATDRYPAFVSMLDFLDVPWREMKGWAAQEDKT